MTDPNDWNRTIIEEFRANAGKVGGQFEGAPMVLLHTTGAKSGKPRVNPLVYQADGDRIVVFASKAGAPTHPDWFHNIVANPRTVVEVGPETVDVVARVAEEGVDARLRGLRARHQPRDSRRRPGACRHLIAAMIETPFLRPVGG